MPGWVTCAIVAENSNVHPRYYDPQTPRMVWYYRVLALHNARVDAKEYRDRLEQQRQNRAPKRRH